jgi:hypothetical protein
MGISLFYSGAVPMDFRGMNGRVQMQLQMGIYHFYSGAVQMDARGMNQLAQEQL